MSYDRFRSMQSTFVPLSFGFVPEQPRDIEGLTIINKDLGILERQMAGLVSVSVIYGE